MVKLTFTPNLLRHVDTPESPVSGDDLRQILDSYFQHNPRVRGYLLDDQGALRHHVLIFLNRQMIRDRDGLTDAVRDGDEIYIAQALSGG
jgi:molybdopterin converting factor small subunit